MQQLPRAVLSKTELDSGRSIRTPESPDPYRPTDSYFRSEPFVQQQPIVYEGKVEQPSAASYWFVHTLGAIITGAIDAGLHISHLKKYPHSNREELYDRYERQAAQLPLCYSLVAVKGSQSVSYFSGSRATG